MPNTIDPRILFAAERTLLAWNRTSLALIAFGFLVERSGLLMVALLPDKVNEFSMQTTFWCGLGFILLGAACALYSSKQYLNVLKALGTDDIPAGYRSKWGVVINTVVALFGLLLLIALFINS